MSNIKKGYKQTEFGVIPEDWEIVPLDSLSLQIGDGIHSTPIYTNDSDYKFINGNNLKNGNIELSDSALSVPYKEYIRHKKQLTTNTVLYSINGTIGNIAFYNNQKIILGKSAAYVNLKPTVDKRYVFQILQSDFVLEFYENEMTGSTIRNLSLKSLRNTPIPWPNLSTEQSTIATALSDTDALIAALDKKIAKKQQIKQGTMQQLLTGKKRLSGFCGEWVEKKLGEVAEIISGGTPDTNVPAFWDGNILWCTPTDITSNKGKYLSDTQRKITYRGLKSSSAVLLPKGTLLLCSRATIGEVCIANKEVATNQGFKSLVCYDDCSNEFIYYLIPSLKTQMLEVAIGSTFLEISKSNIEKIVLKLPQSKSEQTAIAQILTDMDNEIAQLEKERDKYKEMKAGMMQVLLTGKIRLI